MEWCELYGEDLNDVNETFETLADAAGIQADQESTHWWWQIDGQ